MNFESFKYNMSNAREGEKRYIKLADTYRKIYIHLVKAPTFPYSLSCNWFFSMLLFVILTVLNPSTIVLGPLGKHG